MMTRSQIEIPWKFASVSRVSWGFAGLGILLAAIQLSGGRALWLDEALIALNLRHLGWGEISQSLEYSQMAPIGWIYVQKALLELTGNLEIGLRLMSFGAWAGCILIFRVVLLRHFSSIAAIGGLAIFVLSFGLQMYAVEVKHYEFDVLAAVAALSIALPMMKGETTTWRSWLLLGTVGLFAVFFTFGGLLALGAAGISLAVHAVFKKRYAVLAVLSSIGAVWLLAFALLYFLVYRSQLSGSGLVEGGANAFFERTAYAPLIPTSLGDVVWYLQWAPDFVLFLFGPDSRAPATVLIVLGVGVLWHRRSPELIGLFLGPLLVGLIASGLHLYPMFARLMLFVLPGMILLMVSGFDWIEKTAPQKRILIAIFVMLASASSMINLAGYFRMSPPFARHEVRPALTILSNEAREGDWVYVNNLGIPSYLLYKDQFDLAGAQVVLGRTPFDTWSCILRDVDALAEADRLWILNVEQYEETLDVDGLAEALDQFGLAGDFSPVVNNGGGALYRIDLEKTDRPHAPPLQFDCQSDVPVDMFDAPAKFLR